jgi:hypothetical protein
MGNPCYLVVIDENDEGGDFSMAYIRASELRRIGWSDIRIYSRNDQSPSFEDVAESTISHESTHLVIWKLTQNIDTVIALDNLEEWNYNHISYPE